MSSLECLPRKYLSSFYYNADWFMLQCMHILTVLTILILLLNYYCYYYIKKFFRIYTAKVVEERIETCHTIVPFANMCRMTGEYAMETNYYPSINSCAKGL